MQSIALRLFTCRFISKMLGEKMNLGSISWWAFCTKESSHISLRTSPKSLKRDYYKQLNRDVRNHE